MGSTGSGRLSDYTRFKGAVKGVIGGEDLINKCDRAVATVLEDVETCDYFKKNGHVPTKGTYVKIDLKTRLVALDGNGEIIGHLPTEYHYLLECLNDGYLYEGEVSGSFDSPVPSVYIAVTPQKV